jgi:hypothetical protein
MSTHQATKMKKLLQAFDRLKTEIKERISQPDTSASFKFTMTGIVRDLDVEDSGQAVIGQIDSTLQPEFFVRLQSWSEEGEHPTMLKLAGRNVKITVETIDGGC